MTQLDASYYDKKFEKLKTLNINYNDDKDTQIIFGIF